ncbi:hemin uptake protein HemP [Marivita sp. S0852]|uniref:hemin uptake protein HemP n=1 Tax=Marivita sp. S0852 TaxID=3373893 RepID=UPI003982CCAC
MNAYSTVHQTDKTSTTIPQEPTYDARDLIKDDARACIVLDDQPYYLRITRAGKLILTK